MMRVFVTKGGCLSAIEAAQGAVPAETLWVDLSNPTPEELKPVEAAYKIVAPTREEMQEIEASSRLYREDGAVFMTATIVSGADTEAPESHAVAFILAEGRLITVRHSEPRAFITFPQRAVRQPGLWSSAERVLLGLLDAIVDRTADVLERVSVDVDMLSREIFGARARKAPLDSGDFHELLVRLGRENDLTGRIRESLVSVNRLVTFLTQVTDTTSGKEFRANVKTLSRDIASLSDHTHYLSNKMTFLLDATLGLISTEQNKVIKILAVAGTVFLPPTLFASIWGMNFHHMPELDEAWGYPLAIAVILASGLVPFFYFRWRKWF
ncbi:MAG: magnesium transporter CorA family protein [Alphaproteobacteria bacterium]